MDAIFKALADPGRRRLLDSLNERGGQTLGELCGELDMARQSVSKHLAVLEAAGLVTAVRQGREKLHYLDAAPLNAVADRWLSRYDRHRAAALDDLRTALEEEPPMSDTTPDTGPDSAPDGSAATAPFVHTSYIRTTPERLWEALTSPAFTRRYWGVAFETDWKPGSPMVWLEGDGRTEDPEQVVLEADPPRRLAYTWHTFTPAWAQSVGVDEELRKRIASESRSKVSFDLEAMGETVKLTVVHDGFEPGSTVRGMIGDGWPALLSSLKTLLETGEPLPEPQAES
ncbi:ArsR/SmtB family transcription factor [Streptomyces endophyticus]|uniref:Metalloregulator ArsR/SmtB family transcription factor n=1 Tax=Streptomyces endophyticus TaxID=714166 RepID=A0ABU6EWH3_9ACTN|nr:metalloregulator ArsR/SmtB family transcription factor [Streptomyces endophyticus]MEB8336022.1 metalloregulator ArsR/SmtB family transcription factor [Streptomyces endophyticus]